MTAVLHIDVDVFFCQVEQNSHPNLKGRPFAIQQHQDIIAVNYAARAAGVKKHMAPKEARSLLSKVGGIVHHVHMEAGGRVSYKPYRDVSKVFIQRLRQFAGVGVIEKASIDEAYIQYAPELQHQDGMTNMQQAEQLAQNIRHAVLRELSLVVSVGIGSNKMVAKLASQASKPDGILVVDGDAALHKLLQATPAARLPRCGGKVADTLTLAGVQTVADLQAWSAQQLQQDLGFVSDQAKQLAEWSRGQDSSPVTERPPPKTLSIQMTLTPIPLVMHPSMGQNIAAAGGKAGLLEPLPIGASNFRERLDGLLAAMSSDILGRVLDDKLEEDRWPHKFELQMRAFRNSDRKSKTAVRSCAFPSPSLLEPADSSTSINAETGTGSNLESALVANAIKLSKTAAAILPATWNLVQVEFAATTFSTLSAAAAPSIHRFLHHPASLPAQPAGPLVGTEPGKVLQTDSPKTRIPHRLPDTFLSQHSTGNLDVASTSEAAADHQRSSNASEIQHARECSDGAGCLVGPVAFADVDIDQQRQMLKDFEVRQALSRRNASNQCGLKRTHTGQETKQVGKQSKLVHDTGQRTLTSLFRKG